MKMTLAELKDLNELNNTLVTNIQSTQAQVTESTRQNQELTTSLNVERAKEPLLWEIKAAQEKGVLLTRNKRSDRKFTTSVIVTTPNCDNPSSNARMLGAMLCTIYSYGAGQADIQ